MANDQKADFSSIYNQLDPRQYFTTLNPLSYQIPQQALPYINRVLEASGTFTPKILDVCCSYGINGALVRHGIDYSTMEAYFLGSKIPGDHEEKMKADKAFFSSKVLHPQVPVVGLDVAPNAINYALEVGLLSEGFAEDLESNESSLQLAKALRDVNIVVCTGGVGYVGPSTFRRILGAIAKPSEVWCVAFVLRIFSFDEVAAVFKEYGLVTEKIPGAAFRQRRCSSLKEHCAAISGVEECGLDPTGFESDGWLYAECYIARPAADAAHLPMEQLFSRLQI